jgi:hypothetical protein
MGLFKKRDGSPRGGFLGKVGGLFGKADSTIGAINGTVDKITSWKPTVNAQVQHGMNPQHIMLLGGVLLVVLFAFKKKK